MTCRSCRYCADPRRLDARRPARDRRGSDRGGRDRRVPARAGDERHAILVPALAEPAQPRLSAGDGGARRDPRARRRHVLDLARDHVPLRADDDPGRRRGRRRSSSMSRCWRRASPPSPNSTISITRRTARAYADPAEMAGRIVAAAREAGIGLTLLPVFYAHSGFGGAPPKPEQRRFITDVDGFARLFEACERLVEGSPDERSASRRTACARRRRPNSPTSSRSRATADPYPRRRADRRRSRTASLRSARGRCAGSSTMPASTVAGASSMRRIWTPARRTTSPPRAPSPGSARSPKPISATAFSTRAPSSTPAAASASAPTRTFPSARPTNCGSSNIPSASAARSRNVLARPGGSTGRALFEAALAGGAQALARPSGRLAVGACADLALDAGHPTLAGKSGDAILDAWIFSAGNGLVDCVWSGGRKVVQGGRHVRGNGSRRGSPRRCAAFARGKATALATTGVAQSANRGAGSGRSGSPVLPEKTPSWIRRQEN